MDSIWENREYMARKMPPYVHDWFNGYGKPCDAVIMWYAYTPTGRISKYWRVVYFKYAEEASHAWLEAKTAKWEKSMPRLRKGYVWSKPYLLHPIPRGSCGQTEGPRSK